MDSTDGLLDCCQRLCVVDDAGPSQRKASLTGRIPYKIVVKTGNTKKAGTDADIKIQLIGETGQTTPTTIDKSLRNDFQKGELDEFDVEMEDIGKPLLCKILIDDKGISPDWYVDFVTVIAKSDEFCFPFYEWVKNGSTRAESTPFLPQNESTFVKQNFREDYLAEQQRINEWEKIENIEYSLTGHLTADKFEDLDRNTQWSAERDDFFRSWKGAITSSILLTKFTGVFRNFDSLDDVNKLLLMPWMKERALDCSTCWNEWQTDAEFARQQINGCSPRGVEKVFESLPDYYNIPTADLEKCLPEGVTFESAVADGRIYMVDNSILEGIPCMQGRYTSSPLLVLYCNSEGYLEPLAIQLFSNKAEDNPVFTPKDPPNAWMLAKIFFNSANGQFQQLNMHLLGCHFTAEPFAIALRRCVSRNHPLFCLMFPHLLHVVNSNVYGRNGLLASGALSDMGFSLGGGGHVQLMQRGLKKWTIDDFDVPKNLEKRGLLDDKIKEFGYRDDSLLYWAAIKKYVRGIIELYYKSDDDLAQDSELQNWIKEANNYGFSNADDVKLNEIDTRDNLIHLLTGIIFSSSVQHAADGYPMFDIYGNTAHHPFLLRQPAPADKSATMEDIMNTLPDQDGMVLQMGVTISLSTPPPTEVYLGEFPMKLLKEENAQQIQEQFTKEIQEIGVKIDERNKSWRVPYKYLHPEKVPARIDF
ncbi:Oidioi.mRNA.OKI2018_I69.PAR.g12956.t1.cds [Oikopleura dioica]|uniref:Oidioi.mRNA.OKI2018_I69.PAR.g12956.t1.cds n=1 Tax=Oikopleura dioica TaxID=34765 RepID=A0ABN7S789_OIKDI|nr:Oidioi.mRNA.OKI2018_I69.PAR.g12956.t1.cds [Oikopleura dioica]